jgi:hypothetical protein
MAEQKKPENEQNSGGTETYRIGKELTGDDQVPRSDQDGNLKERAGETDDDFDATSGAGGIGAGGGTSGVPT